MRVSQSTLYGNVVRQTNSALRDIVSLSQQNSSQKRINRPADDPAGMAVVMAMRSAVSSADGWLGNLSTAKGWLGLADEELNKASETLISVMEKAEQAATGTLSKTDRESMASGLRGLFDQLLGISNSTFGRDSVFAGQKTDGPAFGSCLGATVLDESSGSLALSDVLRVDGGSGSSLLVEFTGSGSVGGAADLDYRWSEDGGETWSTGVLAAGETVVEAGGASLALRAGATVTAPAGNVAGSRILIRPSALYLGNGGDAATVTAHGAPDIAASAEGRFSGNVVVRLDDDASLPGPFSYSYSLDGGSTWSGGNTASGGSLPVPGGELHLASNGGSFLDRGDMFTIRPSSGDIELTTGQGERIRINNVGRDIFGGLAEDPATGSRSAALPAEENSFEVVGELIGYLEINDPSGISSCLERLKTVQAKVLGATTEVGARENRVEASEAAAAALKAGAKSHLSRVEDADLTELTTAISRAQYVYQAVLQTSSKIMGMSLLDYL